MRLKKMLMAAMLAACTVFTGCGGGGDQPASEAPKDDAANAILEKMIKLECKSVERAAEQKLDFATTVAKSKPKTRRRLIQAHDLFMDLESNNI